MFRKYLSKIFLIIIILSIITAINLTSVTLAGPMPLQDITFNLQIPKIETTLNSEEWNMYLISIGEFERDKWNFTTHYNNIKTNYLNLKKECGKDNTFYTTIYKMDEEERKHKGCVVNGTYQEVYCFKTITDNNYCSNLIPYKINDKNELSFISYYNSYMWDINKADVYTHFELTYCTIKNNSCQLIIHKDSYPYNPYIMVLENINSTNEIYFSDKLTITDTDLFYNTAIFPSDAVTFHVNLNKELIVKTLKMTDSNKLIIEFENKIENTTIQKENNLLTRFLNWIKNIFN